MDHSDWVRKELRGLSSSLGFIYTPMEEIERRLARVKAGMEKEGMEALLVIQKMDFYYLSGTTQDGLLLISLEGKPLLMIKRELERAKLESPIKETITLKSIREIPALIQSHIGRIPNSLGLELDVLPVKDYFKYQELFPGTKLMDASLVLREARKKKSPFEIDLMKKAGEIGPPARPAEMISAG